MARPLAADEITIGTSSEMDLQLPDDTEPLPAPHHLTLRRRGGTYQLEAESGSEVWVNGESVDALVLATGDVIEVGRDGALLRFRAYPAGRRPQRTVAEVFSDCLDCAHHGADTLLGRAALLAAGLPRELVSQTSTVFRTGVLLTLIALTATSWSLARRSRALEERLVEVTGLAELLAESERNDLTRADLGEILDEIETASERISMIEGRAGGVGVVVREATGSTIFLQGSYGFRDPRNGRRVRVVLGPTGAPLIGPRGDPRLSTDGNGPLLEVSVTGTGFVASRDGVILTNRHVALPWETSGPAVRLVTLGLEPVTTLLAYLPDRVEPFEISLLGASEAADLAALCCSPMTADRTFLELSEAVPMPGDEVVVLGYPLGLRALMARADPGLVEALQRQAGTDQWSVARALSESGYIAPLASRGIVGQLTDRFVVYDAETTSGGSGGPVLGLDGRVLAINTAILPEFGGSNLGVPAREARGLLDRVRPGDASANPDRVPDGL